MQLHLILAEIPLCLVFLLTIAGAICLFVLIEIIGWGVFLKFMRKAFPWILIILGTANAIYLSFAHVYGAGILPACCREPFASLLETRHSTFLGLPVPMLGAAGYLAIGIFFYKRKELFGAFIGAVVLSTMGMLFSMYLMIVSIVILGKVCMFCAASAVIMCLLCITLAIMLMRQSRSDIRKIEELTGSG